MKFVRRNRMQETVELNITAFMNLMVILVPFLLITAVFSRMTVLDLTLPSLDAAASQKTDEVFYLQLTVRKDQYYFQDGRTGLPLKLIKYTEDNANWAAFDAFIRRVKGKFPDSQNVSLLLDKDVNYRTMISVMDHVRSYDDVVAATLETYELFPNVSIGDAEEAIDSAGSTPAIVEGESS